MALKCVSSLPFAQVQANHHSKNLPCEPTSLQPSHLAEHVNVCSSTAIWPWVREEEVDCCSFDNCVTLRYLGCKHAESVCRHLLIYPQLTSSIFTRLSSMIDGQPQCRQGCHNVTAQSVTPPVQQLWHKLDGRQTSCMAVCCGVLIGTLRSYCTLLH